MRKKKGGRDLRLHLAFLLVFLAGLLFPRSFTTVNSEAGLHRLTLSDPEVLKSSFNIVAVSNSGEGALGSVSVEVRKGAGRVLLNTNPFIETDTQGSIEVARSVAEKVSGFSLKDKDVIVTFSINGQFVGGGSAGAATTAALVAAILGKDLNESVVVTGTINPDGSVGQIASILEKAQAVAVSGKKLFLVPAGEGNISYYEKVVTGQEVVGGFVITKYGYTPRVFDLNNYTMTQWGMSVREVNNITDVLSYTLSS